MSFNTWLPGDKVYTFNGGATRQLQYVEMTDGGTLLSETFSVPDQESGFGFTFDMVQPPIEITKPPVVMYSSSAEGKFSLKDSDGWMWTARCPKQPKLTLRGWAWDRFSLDPVQDNTGTLPESPSIGPIQAFQFSAADGATNFPFVVSIAYVTSRVPETFTSGNIRSMRFVNENPEEHTWKVGDVTVVNGTRKPVNYVGSLPFGYMVGGPTRSRVSAAPYRGPYIAGYQSGVPWVEIGNVTELSKMLDFMLESQIQFQQRSPTNLLGPFMHCYLPATWDSEQTGTLDTWVWDAPDGNPAWNGWQYRAIDAMSRTWQDMVEKGIYSLDMLNKIRTINTRFMDWMVEWLTDNPEANYIPSDWGPPGWTQGQPLPPDSYLVPHGTKREPHDLALVLKSAIACARAGYDEAKCKYVINRMVTALQTIQVQDPLSPMRGAFTLNPEEYDVYGFQQGEILEALALAVQNPDLLTV